MLDKELDKLFYAAKERKFMLAIDALIRKYGVNNTIAFPVPTEKERKKNLFQCTRVKDDIITFHRFDSEEQMDEFIAKEDKENPHKHDRDENLQKAKQILESLFGIREMIENL